MESRAFKLADQCLPATRKHVTDVIRNERFHYLSVAHGHFITNLHFRIPDANRFEEGEFRKKVQFMRAGKLVRVIFRFWGPLLDTVHVLGWEGDKAVVEAEVFGDGIKMWLLSQAEFLEVIKPDDFREEMKDTLSRMLNNYGEIGMT